MFLSEDEFFSNYSDKDSLVWYQEGLKYGDWYGGPNSDGSYAISKTVTATPVSFS